MFLPRFPRLIPLTLVLAAVLSGLAATGAQAGETLDKMRQTGELRVGLTGDYRPFSMRDRKSDTGPETNTGIGPFSGLDVDLARSLAGAMRLKLVIVPTSWPTLSDDLTAGRFDVGMGGISVTEARREIGLFSVPMMSDGKTPITRCENVDRFQTLDQIDREGTRVIVNPGGTNEKFARANIHKATIILHPENLTIFDEIIAGRADLMITDAIETRLQSKLHPELCAVHPDTPFDRSEKAYWMPKDPELKAEVDHWLIRFKEIGALQRKIDEWVE